jgi:hypothetical protein
MFKSKVESGQENNKKRQKLVLGAVVAASLLIMAIVVAAINFNGSMTKDELFEAYFEPYEAPPKVSGSANWNAMSDSYLKGDFEKALSQLEYTDSDIHFTWREFYQGMCYLQLEDPDLYDAAYYLNEVRLETSDYKEQANWYYGLVMLVQGRTIEAKKVFNEIKKNRTYNYRKAEAILNTKLEK